MNAVPARNMSDLTDLPPRTAIEKFRLIREESVSWAAIGLSACADAELLSKRGDILHPRELEIFDSDTYGRWRCGYLRGRLCAKWALQTLHDGFDFRQVAIERGVFGQPIVLSRTLTNIQVSLSHSGHWAAAVAFHEGHPMAIDIEVHAENKQDVILANMTVAEIDAIAATNLSADMRPTVLWTIKESLSKVLRTGLMSPFDIYAIDRITEEDGMIVSTFRNFAQYRCLSFSIGEVALSLTLPKRTRVDLDFNSWEAISR